MLRGASFGYRSTLSSNHDVQLSLPTDPWVVMTGGGYFFTPSISALAGALSQSEGRTGVDRSRSTIACKSTAATS